jgi:hypothetical protein
VLAVLVALLAVAAALETLGRHVLPDPEDLRAFYCAGATVAEGRDPYLAEPLRTCEVGETRAAGLAPYERLALPAPLPGFAFAPLAALARLPFTTVTTIYVLFALVAVSVTALLVQRMSAEPPLPIFAALVLSLGWISLANGQLVPFVLLAVCACAFELGRDRPVRASIYAALAAIEPHVALPIWLALAYAVPKTRLPLVVCAVILAAVSLLTIGPHASLEYFTAVLPAHARSEIGSGGQFSLTSLLFRSGVPADTALLFGNASYLLAGVLGIVVAQRLARSLAAAELLALVPPAFAVFGGPFVHLTQFAVAIPAIFVLANRLPQFRAPLGAALLLLAIPWEDLVQNRMTFVLVLIAVVSAPIAFTVWRAKPAIAAFALVAMLVLGFTAKTVASDFASPQANATAALAATDASGTELAETTWQSFVAATENEDSRAYLGTHLPPWAGLALLLLAATLAAFRSPSRI